MLIPVHWLNEFVQTDASPEELAERLTATGNEIEEIRESENGPVFSLKLTPNRSDMLSMVGIAREVAALYEQPFRAPEMQLPVGGPPEPDVRVEVTAPDLCPRYVGRVIRGVKLGPSPEWLQARLTAAGMRPISNVVDVTNYVMWELGQPLHAFDLDRLEEHRILVRRAEPGSTLTLIDGTEVRLQPDQLVIADGKGPVAVAGVMGGRDTEVSDATVNLLLEAAYFDPVSVRRTSKRIGVATAASYRFERGVDPNGTRRAADRACQLITELAGGSVSESVWDVYPAPIACREISFRPARCRELLGIAITDSNAQEYLERLGLVIGSDEPPLHNPGNATPPPNARQLIWRVLAPTARPDLSIEEDLIEEVGRLYGYDRLPETLPAGATGAGSLSAHERLTRLAREQLLAQGLFEAVTNTLLSRTLLANSRLGLSPAWPVDRTASAVPLRNPLSEEASVLRPSLLPGLLQAAEHNLRHGTTDIFFFEVGYGNAWTEGEGPQYRLLLAGLMLGSRSARTWNEAPGARPTPTDFFAARGAIEALVAALGLEPITATRAEHPAFHPGRSAWIEAHGARLGLVGELHPEVAAALDLPRGVYVFELDGDLLRSLAGERRRYAPPSRFPRALRDLAVVVDRTVESAAIEQVLREELSAWARTIRLFDVYSGPPLPEDRISLAYSLELGAEDRTLTDAEVEERLTAARERLRTELGAEFRG